ncbi:ComF family protein [Vibrio sp. T187]|uniref:ComF family protein n=1 Tax=Vibrio TaxID=662 RepID=UPI0010C94B9C|nr:MULTISPECIES: ComF family protein [Vibrio]MBW3697636.1 ComF family protein [Vibrio sp. T187]
MVSDWLQKTTQHYLPLQCQLCRLEIPKAHRSRSWCSHCLELFSNTPRCQRCGLATITQVEQCGQCLSKPPAWHRLYCVSDYQFPASNYVHQVKYSKKFWYARDLAQLLAPKIEDPAPLITSVPLHWTRYLNRGFNQSALITKYLAKELGTTHHRLFTRRRATPSQQGLTKQQRAQNLKNAFDLHYLPSQSHIAIVDDVVTTGSTVQHLCKLLLEVGVKRIDIYCICRTPEPLK